MPPACGVENLLAGKLPAQQQDVQGDAALVTDGAGPADGALWDDPAAVQLSTGAATLMYDLGDRAPVSAFFLQADANDIYRIAGSLDGDPGASGLSPRWAASSSAVQACTFGRSRSRRRPSGS